MSAARGQNITRPSAMPITKPAPGKPCKGVQKVSARSRPRRKMRLALGSILAATLLASVGLGATLPASAGADATIGSPPVPSNAPGLPDGRAYEQVSPVDKDGNEAGTGTNPTSGGASATLRYGLAAPDGNAVLFEGTGPMGESSAGYDGYFVARRTSSGWSTESAVPRSSIPTPSGGTLLEQPQVIDPSADLSHLVFSALLAVRLPDECTSEELYLAGIEPAATFELIEQPEIASPILACGLTNGIFPPIAGGTPDFSTFYFTTPRTLLPEDASRAPRMIEPETGGGIDVSPWGFYEYRDGVLSEAGVLPDGSPSPWGAVPAASGHGRDVEDNQVSADGSRAFFVSPDPASCTTNKIIVGKEELTGENNCAVNPPELYVRENGEKTVLVSQDTLIRRSDGLPVGAPDGAMGFPNASLQVGYSLQAREEGRLLGQSFVYASPDGSQAFFESEDRLTRSAPEGPPRNRAAKMYDFNLNTGSLTYLPGVVGEIAASNADGSTFVFVSPEISAASAELELWSAGPNGGTVTPITQMTGAVHKPRTPELIGPDVSEARVSENGSAVVFMTGQQLPYGFNQGTHLQSNLKGESEPVGNEQIYRYDVPANTLSCVSCAPVGVTSTSSAEMSVLRSNDEGLSLDRYVVDERGVSSDGERIFFDTADPLVPQVSNANSPPQPFGEGGGLEPQGRNVYEWENGVVYLISGGKSPYNSYFLDSSENGGDVFFATAEGLVPGDTDGAYDVYDARVPHPPENPPATAVPCEGSVCQGPPNVPSPLTPPASATFSGLGNPTPEETPPLPAKKTTTRAVKCKKGFVKKKNKCVKKPNAKKSAKGRK